MQHACVRSSRVISAVRSSPVKLQFTQRQYTASTINRAAAAATGSTHDRINAADAAHIKTLAVIGAGQMGTGIAYVAAVAAKLDVLVLDTNQAQLDKAMQFVQSLLAKDVKKGKISSVEAEAAASRIRGITSYSDLSAAEFVIEAASEQLDIKRKIFSTLAQSTQPSVILASNTSSISITKIAAAAGAARAGSVIGMHFMNPVPVMKLVEVISGITTAETTLNSTLALGQRLGKVMTHSKDLPGFIANRLLMPYINEAIYALQDSIGSRDDIDTTMKLGCAMPMGPLQLADFIGLDTCLSIMHVLHDGLGDSKYRPAPLLQQYVDAGWMGKKSGRGFYEYPQ